MTKYLIAGGAGFMGSNFVRTTLQRKDYVLNIDSLTYAGSIENIRDLLNNKNHVFIKCDIGNKVKIKQILNKYKPDFIINFAAETHVDRSIDNPEAFIKTNIVAFFKFITVIKEYWKKLQKKEKSSFRLIQISTDEVYGDIKKGSSTENSKIFSSSPYSASKSSAEQLLLSFHRTYNLPIIITRSSNNYGPYQFPEKLIPLSLMNAISEKKINIYGNGKQIRNWIHVDDHNEGVVKIIKKGKIGNVYNLGSNNSVTNIQLIFKMCELLDDIFPRKNKKSYKNLINFVEDRPGHDQRYSQSINKIKQELKWKPKISLFDGLKRTILWYLENIKWYKNIQKNNYSGKRLGLNEQSK